MMRIAGTQVLTSGVADGAFDVVGKPFQASERQSILRTALDQGVSALGG
jgi:hypothetical protein